LTWSYKTLGNYITEKLKVHVADSTIVRHLHRLGWALDRTVLTMQSHESAYPTKAAELELLKERARCGEFMLLFEDKLDLDRLPDVLRCWTRVGEQPKIPTPGSDRRSGHALGRAEDQRQLVHAGGDHVSRFCPGANWTGPKVVLELDNYTIQQSTLTQETLTE